MKKKIHNERISRNRYQIILNFPTGLKLDMHELKDEFGIYDEVNISLQAPELGGKKRLDQNIVNALNALRGKHTVKNIKVIITTRRKIKK